jgi:drug/metabolite transporter (DMT)-like permease
MARPLEISLLALLGLLWGIPYALNKIALATIPPVTLVATRLVLAAAVLWIVVFVRGHTMPARRNFIGSLFTQGCITCALHHAGIRMLHQFAVDTT